jgi:hypothetical protein
VNAKLEIVEREVKKNRADWERNIQEAKVLFGLQCELGRRMI